MNAYILVGLGGAIGAMLRYGAGVSLGSLANGFPVATFAVNLAGSIAMGLLIGILAKTTPQYQNEIRLFLAVGIFGGFTTFSSFSLDAFSLLERGDYLLAGLYILGSVALGIVGLAMGLFVVRMVA